MFLVSFVLVVLGIWLLISGTVANIRTSMQKRRIDELAEKNAKLEASLRRLQTEIQNVRSGNGASKNEVLTLAADFAVETEKTGGLTPPAREDVTKDNGGLTPPAQKAVPVAPFAVPPPKPATAATPPPAWNHSAFAPETSGETGGRMPPAHEKIAPKDTGGRMPPAHAPAAIKRPPLKEGEPSPQQTLELWIGRKLFGWVAVAGFIVAAALLIRHAVEHGWVGPEFKVAGITLFGFGLLGLGHYFHRTGLRRFSTMMSSGGIILVFQAGYASFGIYKLIPLAVANAVLPLIVVGGFLLAWFYRSRLLGVVSICGGLAVPMLLASPTDNHLQFFAYLLLLNVGTVLLVNLLRRVPIAFIAFFGTQALFWVWFDRWYEPEKIYAALAFHIAFYVIYFADTTVAARTIITKKTVPRWDDAMRAVLAPILFFGSLYFLSDNELPLNEEGMTNAMLLGYVIGNNLGYFAFVGAAWYALLSVIYTRRLARVWDADVAQSLSMYWKAAPSAALVIAFGFVAVGIPLQCYAEWVTVSWMTVFAGLWFCGHQLKVRTFVNMSYVFFVLGFFRLINEIEQQFPVRDHLNLTPLFNTATLPILAVAVLLIAASVAAGRCLPKRIH